MIRELNKNDAEQYWYLRHTSLLTNPQAFGTTVSEWEAVPVAQATYRVQARTAPFLHFMLGYFEGKQLVGAMGFTQREGVKRQHKGLLWGVYVLPAYRGKGIGSQLLDAVLARVRQAGGIEQVQLSVWAGNETAVSLYTSRGFAAAWLEKNSFKTADGYLDELHMVLDMKGATDGKGA